MKKKKRVITTNSMDIKRLLIKEYYEQRNAHKFDAGDKRDQSFERHNFPKLTQRNRQSESACLLRN